MSDIALTDVTIHIDKELDDGTRSKLENALRTIKGVVSVRIPADKQHLVLVEYNPDDTSSSHILAMAKEMAGHAEMVGL